jgi:hypothetical protein
LPSNYGKSLNYQVSPAKTGLISRGEHHSLSWQFLLMRDRKRVRSKQRSLLLRFPAQIETSASREIVVKPIEATIISDPPIAVEPIEAQTIHQWSAHDIYSFKQMRNVVKSGLILKIPRATQCGFLSAHILTYQQLHVILIAFQLSFV